MTGTLPKKFQDRVKLIPTHLQFATSTRSLKYSELLSAINLMDKERCIGYTPEEFSREFGKNGVQGLRTQAKKAKVPFILRIIQSATEIIIFKNDLPARKV